MPTHTHTTKPSDAHSLHIYFPLLTHTHTHTPQNHLLHTQSPKPTPNCSTNSTHNAPSS